MKTIATLLAIAGAGALAFVVLAVIVGSGGATSADVSAFELAADIRSGHLVDVAKAVTALGALPAAGGAAVAAAIVLAVRRHAVEAAVLVAGLAIVVAAVHFAKAGIDRPRPGGALVSTQYASFPSGHAAYSIVWIAIALAVARLAKGSAATAALLSGSLVLAVAIGLTRVELRAHYLTDVLAGWGLAAAVLAGSALTGLLVARVRQNGPST